MEDVMIAKRLFCGGMLLPLTLVVSASAPADAAGPALAAQEEAIARCIRAASVGRVWLERRCLTKMAPTISARSR
jgi:hypothetical protein